MTHADLDALDAAERRFAELTLELRDQARRGETSDSSLFVEWMQANYAFHDVIYAAAAMPLVERLAKSARRTFIGDRVWSARPSSTSSTRRTISSTGRSARRSQPGAQRAHGCSHASTCSPPGD